MSTEEATEKNVQLVELIDNLVAAEIAVAMYKGNRLDLPYWKLAMGTSKAMLALGEVLPEYLNKPGISKNKLVFHVETCEMMIQTLESIDR